MTRPSDGVRVAVQVGSATLRLAVTGPGSPPGVVAELPAPVAPDRVPTVVRALLAHRPAEIVVVHPAGWDVRRVREATGQLTGLADRVRAVAAPLAVAGPGHAVLDVGRRRTEAAVVGADGGLRAVRCVALGGEVLDAAVARLLAVPDPDSELRERLSLQPQARRAGTVVTAAALRPVLTEALGPAVAALAEVLAAAGTSRPAVVLAGGVARTPLLAELADDLLPGNGAARVARASPSDGWGTRASRRSVPARVAVRPDAAAVLGALRLPASLLSAPLPDRPPPGPSLPDRPPLGTPAPGGPSAGEPADARPTWLPPPRRGRTVPVAGLAVAAITMAAVLGLAAGASGRAPDPAPPGMLVQYGYQLQVPAGWEHTGGLPERRRSLLTPAAAPAGSDLVSVEQTPLGYDADAEPDRARAELRAEFEAAAAAGAAVSGYDDGARLGGRPVVAYRQAGSAGRASVDWYVVLDGPAQLSVGCQHTARGADAVAAACAVVVATIRRSA